MNINIINGDYLEQQKAIIIIVKGLKQFHMNPVKCILGKMEARIQKDR